MTQLRELQLWIHFWAPPPPPPPPPPLFIPQGLGAFTFLSFLPRPTISPQLFIGAARSRVLLSLLVAAGVCTSTGAERKDGEEELDELDQPLEIFV